MRRPRACGPPRYAERGTSQVERANARTDPSAPNTADPANRLRPSSPTGQPTTTYCSPPTTGATRRAASRPSSTPSRENSSTAQLIFPVADLVAYLSNIMTLSPGDLIFTGTPPGVGMARKPPVWLRNGDVVEVEIDGLGVLRNPVVAEK